MPTQLTCFTLPPGNAPIDPQVLSLTGSVIYLSSLLSAIAATPLANFTGRKGVMWVMGALVVAATVLGASSESLAQIFVARAVAGLAVGLGFQVGVSDSVPKARVGASKSCCPFHQS